VVKSRTLGNKIAPPRFLAFLALLASGTILGAKLLHSWPLAAMAGFDIASFVFLASCIPLLSTLEASTIREHAVQNDANRIGLLVITAIVLTVLLIAIAAEAVGKNPEPFTKALIIATLALAWLFSNTVYALHYAHLAYRKPDSGCMGLDFPGTKEPIYWDFVYFAFTCGMAFATSDVAISDQHIRRVVTVHCLAAFAFNIGVLAFTINVLGASA
jgi:uncharacterized membrane protein